MNMNRGEQARLRLLVPGCWLSALWRHPSQAYGRAVVRPATVAYRRLKPQLPLALQC